MPEFKLDELELTRNNTTYEIRVLLNRSGAKDPNEMVELKNDLQNKNLSFTPKKVSSSSSSSSSSSVSASFLSGLSPGTKLDASYPGIDFGTYGSKDMLSLLIKDDENFLKEMAGVCIRDTDYPPPYTPNNRFIELNKNNSFSAKFIMEHIKFSRLLPPNDHLFSIDFTLSFDPSVNYQIKSFQLETDTRDHIHEALMLKIDLLPGASQGQLTYSATFPNSILLMLKNYSFRGLPLIIYQYNDQEEDTNWENIDTKKMSIYIF